MEEQNFERMKSIVLDNVAKVLITKNERYGNSALSPIHIFYKGENKESIKIRIDDKISRVKNSNGLRKNDMFDILGYVFLFLISMNETNRTFEEKVQEIKDYFDKNYTFDMYSDDATIFGKGSNSLLIIDESIKKLKKINDINMDDVTTQDIVLTFATGFIGYFIENDIMDFSDLID